MCSALLGTGTAGALLMAAFGPSCLCLPSDDEEQGRIFDDNTGEEECREWCRQVKLQNAAALDDECSTADEQGLWAPVLAALSLLLQPLSCASPVAALLSEGDARLPSGQNLDAAIETQSPHVGVGSCRMAALARFLVVALRQAASDASSLGDERSRLRVGVCRSALAAIAIARRLLHLSTPARPHFPRWWHVALLREGAESALSVLCDFRRRHSRASRDADAIALVRAACELASDCKRVGAPYNKAFLSREQVLGEAVERLGWVLDKDCQPGTQKSSAQDTFWDDRTRELLASLLHLQWALFGGTSANGRVLVGLVSTHELLS